jgi:phosphoglycolate phosphatase
MPLEGVFFDLDGTLVDTAPDMTAALNRLRAEHGLPEMPYAELRPYVSRGSPGLVGAGFGDLAEDDRARLTGRFLALYAEGLCVASAPFAGILDVLDHLDAHALPWGIVTNKPGALARPLLERLALGDRMHCLVSGDCLPVRKPHPLPLLHAASLVGAAPERCVYVGDDLRDVEAGRAAGMRTLVARWGYVPPDQDPDAWHADGHLDSPAHLLAWLRGEAPAARAELSA